MKVPHGYKLMPTAACEHLEATMEKAMVTIKILTEENRALRKMNYRLAWWRRIPGWQAAEAWRRHASETWRETMR